MTLSYPKMLLGIPYIRTACIPRWNDVETTVSTSFQHVIHVVFLWGVRYFQLGHIYVLGTQALREGVVERKYTIAYVDGVTSGSIFVCACYFRYILQLCKKATGMILSLSLALQMVFFCHKSSKYSNGTW